MYSVQIDGFSTKEAAERYATWLSSKDIYRKLTMWWICEGFTPQTGASPVIKEVSDFLINNTVLVTVDQRLEK